MSNVSNLNTIRKNYNDLESFQCLDGKLFLKNLRFLKSLKKALEIKNVDTVYLNCYVNASLVNITAVLFFRVKKTRKIKWGTKRLLSSSFSKTFKEKKNKKSLNFKNLNFFFPTLIKGAKIKITNLNKFIKSETVTNLYLKLKKFLTVIFTRRTHLFIDFIKINSLLLESKVSCKFYLYYLGLIFKFLLKRKHSAFIMFLKYIFSLLRIESQNKIKGIKFTLSGRFQAKMRANSVKFMLGAVPLQSLSSNIDYSKINIYTRYGVFGFKLWINT